jgi:hypothetical protein
MDAFSVSAATVGGVSFLRRTLAAITEHHSSPDSIRDESHDRHVPKELVINAASYGIYGNHKIEFTCCTEYMI